ncbi:MAG: hypothetical protein ABIA93_02825 [Candidatus Woesearchaeota archaeon]
MNRKGDEGIFTRLIFRMLLAALLLIVLLSFANRQANLTQFHKEYYSADIALTLDSVLGVPGDAQFNYYVSSTRTPLFIDITKKGVTIATAPNGNDISALMYPRASDLAIMEDPSSHRPPWLSMDKTSQSLKVTKTQEKTCPSSEGFTLQGKKIGIFAPEDKEVETAMLQVLHAFMPQSETTIGNGDVNIGLKRGDNQVPRLILGTDTPVTKRMVCLLREEFIGLGDLLESDQTYAGEGVLLEMPKGVQVPDAFAQHLAAVLLALEDTK